MSDRPALGTRRWYDTATDQELRDHVDNARLGSEYYQAGMAEISRRDAIKAAADQIWWIKATFIATLILGLAAIAATLAD